MLTNFSDYIVYVDESGDHSLSSINPQYPMFVLAFCIFKKVDYAGLVVPSLQKFKFKYFGHDLVILHEYDLRKAKPPFSLLLNPNIRESFMNDLNEVLISVPMEVVSVAINKSNLNEPRSEDNPYHIALELGLKYLVEFVINKGQEQKLLHVVF